MFHDKLKYRKLIMLKPLITLLATTIIFSSPATADDNKFSIGIGSYSLAITDQVNTQTFSGVALNLGYTIYDFLAVNAHVYSLQDEVFTTQEMNGYDLALRAGKFSPGFVAFVQAGIFSETLSSSVTTNTRDFSVTFLGFGAGYKWEQVGVELDYARRAIKDYQSTSTADIDAATSSLSVSYLF